MTIRSEANFQSTYLTTSGTWPDNVTGDISPADLRAGMQDIVDSTALGWSPNYDVNPPSGIKFGNIQTGNYSEFQEDTGFHFAYGSGMAWDDLRFPAVGINPPGSIRDADRDTSDTVYAGTLLYDADVEEMTAGQAQMPHSWKEGSTIHPHIHWAPTDASSGNVIWQLDYDIANVSGNFAGSYSTITITGVVENDPTKHQLLEFGTIDMSGYSLSTMILWRISRIGDSGDDTYSEEARLFEFDIHYQINSYGSRQEYIK